MKAILGLLVISSLILAPIAFIAKPEHHEKFTQPAAPMAAVDDCTGCDTTYPTPGGGSAGTILFDRCLYISHYIYFQETDHHSVYACNDLTNDELAWVNSNEGWWLTTQAYMAGLTYSASGNYCRITDTCGTATYYHLAPYTGQCGNGDPLRVYLTTAVYNGIAAAATAMSCTQCFLRTKCGFDI